MIRTILRTLLSSSAVLVIASGCAATTPAASPVAATARADRSTAAMTASPVASVRTPPSASATAVPADLAAEIPVGRDPGYLEEAFGFVWVANHHGDSVSRIDPATNVASQTIAVPGEPVGIRAAFDSLWTFTPVDRAVKRIDPGSGSVTVIPVGVQDGPITGLVAASGAVWLSGGDGRLHGIDPRTNKVTRSSAVLFDDDCAGSMAAAAGKLWRVPECGGNRLEAIDPKTLAIVTSIDVPPGSVAVWSGLNRLWVVSARGQLAVIDPKTGHEERRGGIGFAAEQLRTGIGRVWVRLSAHELAAVDPGTLAVTQTYALPRAEIPGGGIAIGSDSVWAANFGADTVWRITP